MEKNIKTNEEIEKLAQETTKYKHYCKCGHTVVIYPMEHKNKKLCSHCGKYVFTDKKEQDKYYFKLKMKMLLKG